MAKETKVRSHVFKSMLSPSALPLLSVEIRVYPRSSAANNFFINLKRAVSHQRNVVMLTNFVETTLPQRFAEFRFPESSRDTFNQRFHTVRFNQQAAASLLNNFSEPTASRLNHRNTTRHRF